MPAIERAAGRVGTPRERHIIFRALITSLTVCTAEVVADKSFLDPEGVQEHRGVDRLHIIAMYPHLAHLDIRPHVVSIDQLRRRPGMVWHVRAIVEEEDRVAEEDGDGDGQQDGDQPVAGSPGAITGECPADGMVGSEAGGFGGAAQVADRSAVQTA